MGNVTKVICQRTAALENQCSVLFSFFICPTFAVKFSKRHNFGYPEVKLLHVSYKEAWSFIYNVWAYISISRRHSLKITAPKINVLSIYLLAHCRGLTFQEARDISKEIDLFLGLTGSEVTLSILSVVPAAALIRKPSTRFTLLQWQTTD